MPAAQAGGLKAIRWWVERPSMDGDSPWSAGSPYPALSLYAAAMAYVEAAVVVYLRALYHPAGFFFPLEPIPLGMALTELGREAATILMIAALALLSRGSRREQFAAFVYVFGVWDIFYYAWLKVLIGWPKGLLDPDVLFLIPAPWVGPVLAPMLVSSLLIALAWVLRPPWPRRSAPAAGRVEWALLLGGAALVLWTFIRPNLRLLSPQMTVVYPERYAWEVFSAGWLMGAGAIMRLVFK